jgi:uncharacterized protein HemX
MKSRNAYLITILLLAALGIGGCTLKLIQQKEPATGRSSEEPQEQKANG